MINEIALRFPLLLLATGFLLAVLVAKTAFTRRAGYFAQLFLVLGTTATAFLIRFDEGPDDARMFYIVSAVIFGALGALITAVAAAVKERRV